MEDTQGETIYTVGTGEGCVPGLNEADLQASIATLESLAETINAECVQLRVKPEKEGAVAEFLIRIRADQRDFMEVRYDEKVTQLGLLFFNCWLEIFVPRE